jgi:hypothetical protein
MGRHGRHCHTSIDTLESLLVFGALLWLTCALLRSLLRHPRLWPLVALLWLIGHYAH